MIVGYHVIFSTYGFWLPNDPRGSWSTFVGSWDLFRYGPATKTTESRSLAHDPHNRSLRLQAKSALKHQAVRFNDEQIRSVAAGIAAYSAHSGLAVFACAVMHDHVHLVTGRPAMKIEQAVIQLKGSATERLVEDGVHPFQNERDDKGRRPKCFARGEWKVFLDPDDVERAIRYVENNPMKEGRPKQNWSFVVPWIR
jgi:REP element-mobilizing transposase RayT